MSYSIDGSVTHRDANEYATNKKNFHICKYSFNDRQLNDTESTCRLFLCFNGNDE